MFTRLQYTSADGSFRFYRKRGRSVKTRQDTGTEQIEGLSVWALPSKLKE